MCIRKPLQKFVLACLLAVSAAPAQTPYDEGQRALRQEEWEEAAKYFGQALDSEQADAAMYWRAHALYKAGRRAEAARQINALERDYPDSRWVNEARALRIEYQGDVDATGVDDELRLFALHRLMERDPERALPLVMEMMRETDSPRVRQDALFVLGMSGSEEAMAVIAEVARNSDDPEFQAEAIHLLGMSGSDSSLGLLGELYSASASRDVREAVIHAHIIADEPEPLLGFLRQEPDPRLQRDIIHALGAMGATEELHQLYPGLTGREARIAAIEAFSMAGDSSPLRIVVETEDDPGLRRTAIEMLAVSGDEGVGAYLAETYSTAAREEKQLIIEALTVNEDVGNLVSLYRSEDDPQLRRKILESLTVLDSEEADELLFELLESD